MCIFADLYWREEEGMAVAGQLGEGTAEVRDHCSRQVSSLFQPTKLGNFSKTFGEKKRRQDKTGWLNQKIIFSQPKSTCFFVPKPNQTRSTYKLCHNIETETYSLVCRNTNSQHLIWRLGCPRETLIPTSSNTAAFSVDLDDTTFTLLLHCEMVEVVSAKLLG